MAASQLGRPAGVGAGHLVKNVGEGSCEGRSAERPVEL